MPQAQKLTLKQETFVNEYVVNGQNGTQAALKAYDTTPDVARRMASENMTKPVIAERIETILSKQRLTLDKNLENLVKIANFEPEKISGETVANVNLALLKLRGADPGTKHTSYNVSFKGKLKDMKYQDLKGYVEAMRAENDTMMQELDVPEATETEPDVAQ